VAENNFEVLVGPNNHLVSYLYMSGM